MKKIICIGTISLLIAGMTVSQAFSDVSDKHWAKASIDKMVEQGIISGHTDGTFRPSGNLSKIESVILLSKMAGVNKYTSASETFVKNYEKELKDYKNDHKKYIAYLLGVNVLKDDDLKSFITPQNVTKPITREEIAIIVTRIMGAEESVKNKTLVSLPFDDFTKISPEARPYVEYLYNQSIMKGMSKKEFAPKESVTRAQAAVILNSISDKVNIVPDVKEDIVDSTEANVTLTEGKITDIDSSLTTIEIDEDNIYEYDEKTQIYIDGKKAEITDLKIDDEISKLVVVNGVITTIKIYDEDIEDEISTEEKDNENFKEDNNKENETVSGKIVKLDAASDKKVVLKVDKKEKEYNIVASSKFYQAGEEVTAYDFTKGDEVTLVCEDDEIVEMYYKSEIENPNEQMQYKVGTVVSATSKKLVVKWDNGVSETIYPNDNCKIILAEMVEEIKLKKIEKDQKIVVVGAYEGDKFYASVIIGY